MRAARLLQILLILQNRGRQTSIQLADELEVAPRTILRDVDAMTEAGLPIIVHQGNGGGIELGFNYRTRLTGLAQDEATALGLILTADTPMVSALGLEHAAKRAQAKLIESLPDKTRLEVKTATEQFKLNRKTVVEDARIHAMTLAIRAGTLVRLRFATPDELPIHPVALTLDDTDWSVRDDVSQALIPLADWGRLNVSSLKFRRQPAI
ncbi:YafY family protein [Roseibium sp. MMSF_3544]|uniref:helix-turn-helix transcriptional regulator n=1 Tax=unclassified Roseibium TaxID=2629323 RepID=UPI00273E969C|nr:HTH domain-containing protein [Roseibium sp. MMSF_3544]